MNKENKPMEEEKKEENIEEREEKKKKSGKTEFYIELALFLILGILIGIALKTEAIKRVAIGYDDYKMDIYQNDYNINTMQVEVSKKRAEEIKKQQEAQVENTSNTEEAGALAGTESCQEN